MLRHVIKQCDEQSQLILGFDLDTMAEVTRRDFTRGLRKSLDRNRYSFRKKKAGPNCCEENQHSHDQKYGDVNVAIKLLVLNEGTVVGPLVSDL